MQVRFEGYGRALRNLIEIEPKVQDRMIHVEPLR
jgi:hypothetical protein